MAAAAKRVFINSPTFMHVGGGWQVVYPGSVLDLPAGVNLFPPTIDPTFVESPGNLAEHGGTTPVRNLRTR